MSQSLFASAMSTASGGEPQPRQAALLLRAMSEHDRAWVLSQLPAADRATLLPLLGELETLGIPIDEELLRAVRIGADPLAHLPEHGQAAASDEDAILRASPAALASVLLHEPVELTAQLLRIRAWPWQGEVLKLLPAAKAAGIRTRLERHPSSPRSDASESVVSSRKPWQTSLMQLLQARLDEASFSSGATGADGAASHGAASHGVEPVRPTRRSAWWQRWGSEPLAGRRNSR